MTSLWNILERFGLPIIAIPFIPWFVRKLTAHYLDKDIEVHKSKVQHDCNMALEQFRSQFSISAMEHEITFRSVYEKQAMILARTYHLLHDLYQRVSQFTAEIYPSDSPTFPERLSAVQKTKERVSNYFFPRRLFFPQDSSKAVTDVIDSLAKVTSEFTRELKKEQRTGIPPQKDYWVGAAHELQSKIDPLLAQMHDDFQRILTGKHGLV